MSQLPGRPELPKRFYTDVTIAEEAGGFAIHLDGRPIRTPAREILRVPQRPVAEALANEWDAQRTEINPATMPMTRLVNTVLDGVAARPDAVREDLERYAETDLLIYRASGPDRLVARQKERWDPIVSWAETEFGRLFAIGEGVIYVAQPPETVAALRDRLRREADPFRLAALHQITTLTGSLLLALAVHRGRLSGDDAWTLAHVDEDWNVELWGADEEAAARRASRFLDLSAASLILASSRD